MVVSVSGIYVKIVESDIEKDVIWCEIRDVGKPPFEIHDMTEGRLSVDPRICDYDGYSCLFKSILKNVLPCCPVANGALVSCATADCKDINAAWVRVTAAKTVFVPGVHDNRVRRFVQVGYIARVMVVFDEIKAVEFTCT